MARIPYIKEREHPELAETIAGIRARRAGMSAASLVMAGGAFAQTYPTKPIRFIVPVTTGGGSDPLGNTSREAMEFLKVEIARWGKVIKQAGVRIE